MIAINVSNTMRSFLLYEVLLMWRHCAPVYDTSTAWGTSWNWWRWQILSLVFCTRQLLISQRTCPFGPSRSRQWRWDRRASCGVWDAHLSRRGRRRRRLRRSRHGSNLNPTHARAKIVTTFYDEYYFVCDKLHTALWDSVRWFTNTTWASELTIRTNTSCASAW